MKKLTSLFLALVLSLSLAVPAMAAFHDLEIRYPNGENIYDLDKGDGWTCEDDVLTLNGVKDLEISIGASPTIVLAPGSKNTLTRLWGGDSEVTNDITIKGSGELIIYSPTPYDFGAEDGAFAGLITSLKLEDGLVMTGGAKEGGSEPLSLQVIRPEDPTSSCCTADKKPAMYVRIAPADGTPAEPAAPSATKFTDVAANSPYKDAIAWAVEQGITKGTTATTFSPNAACTEGQILTFLYRAAGSPNKGGNEWDGVVDWTDDHDVPLQQRNTPCTRANAMYYMWIALGKPASNAQLPFTDLHVDSSVASAIRWAVEKGITTGTSPTAFSPDTICTRGQIVTFLYRASK